MSLSDGISDAPYGSQIDIDNMAENIEISTGSKSEKYTVLLPQIATLLEHENDAIACMANVSAALAQTFRFLWTGFYRVIDAQLVLGPFQGPLACTRIQKGKGVCGASWQSESTIIVHDVNAFPGHIACSSASLSEIVVPIKKSGKVCAVLDIDSDRYATFDDVDAFYLEQIADLISYKF